MSFGNVEQNIDEDLIREELLDKIIKRIDRQRVAVGANPSKVEGLSLAIDIVESFRRV